MTINQAILLAKKLMSNYPELKYWNVTFNNRKRAFGVCNYRKHQIELSSLLVPAMTENAIQNTIIHEIAHALTPGHNHDSIWKAMCIKLGGNGQRCGGSEKYEGGVQGLKSTQEKLAKYTLTCPCCGKTSYANRKPRTKSCGVCCPRHYNENYKLVVTQNY